MRGSLGRRLLVASVLVLLVGAGGAAPSNLKLKGFDAHEETNVGLDRVLAFHFRSKVKQKHFDLEVIRIFTDGGQVPAGEFLRGEPLVDPATRTIVVVDPDQMGPGLIEKIERRGRVDLIPREIRYDLGHSSTINGNRRVLFDRSRSRKKIATFVPELPDYPDLSDAGYVRGATYDVEIGRPGRKKQIRSSFTVVRPDDPSPFSGLFETPCGIVHTDPASGDFIPDSHPRIRVRFSQPLDPRTVTPENIFLSIISVSGRPEIPFVLELRQTLLGTVELIVTPEQPLPATEVLELTISHMLRDLRGAPCGQWVFTFFTEGSARPVPLVESFETNDREDGPATTANWNGTKPIPGETGALVAAYEAASPGASTALSLWHDSLIPTPNYGPPVLDRDAHGGGIEVFVQGSREDVATPGPQPVDPDDDPLRLRTTDWAPLSEIDKVDNHQYLRFRVEFTLPEGYVEGNPLPILRRIEFPATASRD